MRSKLFVPGARPELFAKAAAGAADALSFDLEDSVPAAGKAAARDAVAAFIAGESVRALAKALIVRVNAPGTPWFEDDLAAVARDGLALLNLPKIESADDLRAAVAALEHAEARNGVRAPLRLLVNIETPRALANAAQIAMADPRVAGLQVGLGDLFEPLGIDRHAAANVHAVLFAVRMAAAQAGVFALDGAWPVLDDAEGYAAEAQRAGRVGERRVRAGCGGTGAGQAHRAGLARGRAARAWRVRGGWTHGGPAVPEARAGTAGGGARLKRWALAALLALLYTLAPAGLRAQSLVSLESAAAAPVPAGAAPLLAGAVGDRLLLFAADGIWLEQPDPPGWGRQAWPQGLDAGRLAALAWSPARTLALASDTPDGPARQLLALRIAPQGVDALPLAALPQALAQAQLAVNGAQAVALGLDAGGRARMYGLALDQASAAWQELAAPPAAAGTLLAQGGALYASVAGNGGGRLLRWHPRDGWTEAGALPAQALPGAARAMGQGHLLYLLRDPARPAGLRAMTYHTVTRAWADVPAPPVAPGALVTPVGDALALVATGAAGGAVQRLSFASPDLLLEWVDWLIIAVYLLAMLGIGGYFYLREKRGSTDAFFVGGRSIPFWAAGVSLYATNVSSISFIAIPAKAFETNWTYLANNLIAVLGLMFVAVWIVPLLRRLDLMSVFSYLETRFHPGIRMIASALCIVTQIGSRMSIILFLPALAIASITGIDVVWSILMMGVFTIIYTTLGGMKAVIWTDFVQVFVMFGGAIFAIAFIVLNIDGGATQALQVALAEDKTKLFDFSFDLTQATVWGFIFLVLFDVVLTFPKDQVLMQRVLSTRSDKEAGRSIWTFAAIMIPGGFFFYAIGTALYVFYQANPERMNPTLPLDATFPLFIAAELPAGVTGLIIAGIFAAAMSTLSSIINSVSTLAAVDFYQKLAKNPTPEKSVRFAEWIGVLVGIVGIGIAIVLSRFDIRSLFDVSIEMVGLLGGGFAGAYTLGMFTRRANAPGVAIGIGSSLVLTFVIWTFQIVHPYFYLAISIMLCIVIGYAASLFFPAPTRSLEGLTIHRRAA
jgi:SSS family solute:Na+ symporter